MESEALNDPIVTHTCTPTLSQEREREQQKGVQDKLTFAGRIQASRAALRRELSQSDEPPVAQTACAARESPDWRKASTHCESGVWRHAQTHTHTHTHIICGSVPPCTSHP